MTKPELRIDLQAVQACLAASHDLVHATGALCARNSSDLQRARRGVEDAICVERSTRRLIDSYRTSPA